MACVEPLNAWHSRELGANGKRLVTFQRNQALNPDHVLKLPCGGCIQCRLAHARSWAARCMHEAQMHDQNSFLTLTYDDDHLPSDGGLVREHPQLFLKRLRTAVAPTRFRFFGCGEYGEKSGRAHYHLLLFGKDFPDKKFYSQTQNGDTLYTSEFLQKHWTYGNVIVGDVTWNSASYVAGYVTGKLKGEFAEAYYGGNLPPFSMMSRRPGIGSTWFEKYGRNAYANGSVVVNGREMNPPRFYDTRFEKIDAGRLEKLKSKRKRQAVLAGDNSRERRYVKHEVARLNLRKREF